VERIHPTVNNIHEHDIWLLTVAKGSIKKGNRKSEILLREVEVGGQLIYTCSWANLLLIVCVYLGLVVLLGQLHISVRHYQRVLGEGLPESMSVTCLSPKK
jgi:hypothetical protein